VLSKFYRDSACFPSLLFADESGDFREYALDVVKKCAGENPSELEVEIVKMFAGAANSPRPDLVHLGSQILDRGYIEQRLQRPPSFNYRQALKTEQHYDHGDFLVRPFDTNEWRYVPEMLFADGELRAYHEELYKFFTESFWNKRFDGLPYHRLVEKSHMVPLDDVREMVARGFMRMYIPKEFGGEGFLKAHYYILCPLSMRYADPSYALTIMAHSSIGTTPILLGLNQDLPRAKADLQQFLDNPSVISNLKSEILGILRMLDSPEALKVKKVFTALGEKVKNEIGKKPMLRAVAAEFLNHFMDAGRAGLRMDLPKFKAELQSSLTALDTLRPRAEAVVAELDRRAEAAKLFLRLISAGQISAFALTEPSAGSDSGGIQTRATLKRVEVLTDSDGTKYFMLGDERRDILDAAAVDVAKIDYGGYDHATSTGLRSYEGRPFHDIAQIRREDGKEFYEYYELNGAKMWITNGHVAGVMCLYARTPEGPTGFMVDRHAEGLVVGKDEEKMGQRGSPTNELGLTSVRVPRENIIGIEGRGQVNALETLNVGRTGLCVSVTAMIAKIIDQTREYARDRGQDKEPWVQQLVGEMAVELYAVESLAYELIGRFDHHGTKDVRTESAIGKYHASEALHRVVAAAERIYGIESATQLHELEKHRRDARVLNIYEGTNEVQRFLILRDLVDHVLPKATNNDELVRDLKLAVDTFGPQVWQNTGLQPTMFKLAEMAGYIKLIDSSRWRTEWLRNNTTDADVQHRQLAETMSDRYVEFARGEIQRLHEEFEREFELLKQGMYPPQVRAAFLALQAEETHNKHGDSPRLNISKPSHLVVVANVVPVLSPQPRVSGGELLETCFEFDAASRTALERALEVSEARVSVLAVAPNHTVELLRRALASGAHDATLIETDDLPDDVHATARLLADQISSKHSDCDLVLCGDALLGTILAGNLGFPSVMGVEEFEISDQKAVLSIVAAETSCEYSVDDYFSAFQKPLTIVNARELEALPQFTTRYEMPPQPVAEASVEATPESAAKLLRTIAGVAGSGPDGGHAAFDGVVELAELAKLPVRNTAVFVATPDQLDGIPMARECADALLLPSHVVVLGDVDEQAIRRLAARVEADSVYFVTNPNLADAPPDGIVAALQSLWKDTMPAVVASGSWANEILARFAMTFPRVQARYNVAQVLGRNGTVELAWPILGGKLHRVAAVASLTEHPLVMTVAKAEGAEWKTEGKKRVFHVPLEFEYSSEETEAHETNGAKSIADAEFIIDVGYAVRNRENFDYIIGPLKKRLEEIGVKSVTIGGTRKVVEELKLLSPEQQIGQTGTSVNPQVIVSIGVSGAPQHIDYIGERATIIAFNKDPEAPLMTLNQRRARPKVVPIVGDLFETVPRFIAALTR
jgi:alkylation response protein AidB-like acyl-CoA dehydrogenase/electron transfer flavoprotein alpha subunit